MSQKSNKFSRESPAFSSSLWAQIHKSFGEHYHKMSRNDVAIKTFEKSLDKKKNLVTISKLTGAKCEDGDVDGAVEVFKKLENWKIPNKNLACNLQECDCYYDSNQFEENMLQISNKASKFSGVKKSEFDKRFHIVQKNFDDTIGKNAGFCLFDQRKYLDKIIELRKNKEKAESEVQIFTWKQLKDNNECDVVSIQEIQEEEKSVSEKHRLKQIHRAFAQIYLQSGWKDYDALLALQNDPVILDSVQNMETNNKLRNSVNHCLSETTKIMKQLHARCPMYTYKNRMFADTNKRLKEKKISEFRTQYKIRREMFNQLLRLRELRDEGSLFKLIFHADKYLGNFYQITHSKFMPRKEEYITEICNIIALAHLDKIGFSRNYENIPEKYLEERLAALFNVSLVDKSQIGGYIFGVQSTYRDPGQPDTSFISFKKNIDRLDGRLQTAYLPIEKCHLYHEIAKQNLKQGKFDEVRNFGRKAIDEAEKCGSLLWHFLGVFVSCKADVLQRNVLKLLTTLHEAKEVVGFLKDPDLIRLIDVGLRIAFEIHRKSQTSVSTKSVSS